jgi:hypothetical protein
MHCEWLGPWLVPGWRSLLTQFGLPPSATVFLSSSDKEWAGKLQGKRMEVTISECAENARLCEWYASRVENEGEKKVFRRMAKHWQALAAERENIKSGRLPEPLRSFGPDFDGPAHAINSKVRKYSIFASCDYCSENN